MKSRVFIGSSAEGRPLADSLQLLLEPDIECMIWNQGVFDLSTGALESITSKAQSFDFAVLIYSPDDSLRLRGEKFWSARDNVILETGLFIGSIGRERTMMLFPESLDDFRVPTDLLGITVAGYDPQRFKNERLAALGRAATLLREQIERLGPRPRRPWDLTGLSLEDIEYFYEVTGLSYAYLARREATDRIAQDICDARESISMYARVYISELIKDTRVFSAAIESAVRSSDGGKSSGELVISHASTDPEDTQLVEKVWEQEDPQHREWTSADEYRHHLRRSDVSFEKIHRELGDKLRDVPIAERKRVRMKRRYITGCVLPYSLVIIDDRVVYVSYYSLSSGSRFGSFAPTMRLTCDGCSKESWARAFLREKVDIDINYCTPEKLFPLI